MFQFITLRNYIRHEWVKASKLHFFLKGSYLSAHVLLNLLNELKKRDKVQALGMLDSIYDNKKNWNQIFGVKTWRFCHMRDLKA